MDRHRSLQPALFRIVLGMLKRKPSLCHYARSREAVLSSPGCGTTSSTIALGQQDGSRGLGHHEQTGHLPTRSSGSMTCCFAACRKLARVKHVMAQSVTRRIERSLTASAGFQSRPTDKASICGTHQGQRSCETAPKGRTHDCKRLVLFTKKTLASWEPSTHEAASKRLLTRYSTDPTISQTWKHPLDTR